MLNPVVGESNKKPHLCGGVQVCERSRAPSTSEHLIITPLRVHHFPLRSSLTDIRNSALRLKYFSMFVNINFTVLLIHSFCSSHLLKKIKEGDAAIP